MATQLDAFSESNRTDDHGFFGVASSIPSLYGQSATVGTAAKLESVKFYLKKNDPSDGFTPYGQLRAHIYDNFTGTPGTNAVPTGSAYATSDPVSVSSIGTSSFQLYTFAFSGAQAKDLAPGTYFVAIDRYTLNDNLNGYGGNGVYVGTGFTDDGNGCNYTSGSSWQTDTHDIVFRLYGDLLAPVADFSASSTSGTTSLSVDFTDASTNSPTSWAWDFGDGATSTSQNPTHTFGPGLFTVTLTATNAYGSDAEAKTALIHVTAVIGLDDAVSSESVPSPTVVAMDPPGPPALDWAALGREDEKHYIYKVYKPDGTFVGIWKDVKDDPQFTHRINTPGTTMTVRLARSADTLVETREPLVTAAGEQIVTIDDVPMVVTSMSNNTVGTDTDVELNYRVDIDVIYGGFDPLVTVDGEQIVTEAGEPIVVGYGAPNGTRVFSGYVMDYEAVYGEKAGVTVTLASHGAELSQELVRDGDTTTVTFDSSNSLDTQLKAILDTEPGVLSYSTASIAATGITDASKFVLNTKLEAIESLFERTAEGWYWYADVAENTVYLRPTSATPDHYFLLGYHIKSLALRRSIEQLRNAVYFVGGDVADVPIYKKYEDATSQTAWRRVVYRLIDRRYSVATSMQKRADKEMSLYKNPVYVTTLEISSAKYDIETIKLGQVVGFRNFNNWIDGLSLQVVGLTYSPSVLTIDLGMVLETTGQLATDLEQRVLDESTQNIPDTPS